MLAPSSARSKPSAPTPTHLSSILSINNPLELMQEALASSKQEQESNDAEWDARHQEAVDSAEQWKEFADKLDKEKEEQKQQLASASADLQVSTPSSCSWVVCVAFDHCTARQWTPRQAESPQHTYKRQANMVFS